MLDLIAGRRFETLTIRAKVLLGLFVLLAGLAVLAGSALFVSVRTSYLAGVEARLQRHLDVRAAAFERAVTTLEGGVRFLAAVPATAAVVRSGATAAGGEQAAASRAVLAQTFLAYARTHPDVLQLRLIGKAGGWREVVRVNRQGGGLRVVPPAELQAKGRRDYVRAGAQLGPGEVYLSPITLNREHGKIELPHLPVIRFVAPVFARDGRRFGLLVINVDARPLLAGIGTGVPAGVKVFVANASGDLLVHPEAGKTFGFDLGRRHLLRDEFPGLSESTGRAQTDEARGLQETPSQSLGAMYAAVGRLPFASGTARHLTVVFGLPAAQVDTAVAGRFAPFLFGLVFAAALLWALAALSVTRLFSPLQRLIGALQQVGRGRYDVALPAAASGEAAQFLSAFDKMRSDIQRREADNVRLAEGLRNSEAFAAGVIDAMPDALLVIDADGRIVRTNDNASELFGYGRAEFAQHTIEDFVPEDARARHPQLRAAYMPALREGGSRALPGLRARRKNGEEFPVNVAVALMRQAGREYVVVAVSDITRRKALEDELRRNEERFRLMTANIRGYSIIMLDPEGRVLTWNEGAERLYGYTGEEMVGQPFGRLYTPEEIEAGVPGGMLADARAKGVGSHEGWRQRKDGVRFFAQTIVSPTYGEDGEPLGFVKIAHDQSDRLSAEMAQAANEAKSLFLANMSHEIRTPLNGVIGLAQLLFDTPLNARQRDYLGKLQGSARSLLAILNDILDYSKIEAGRVELESAPFELDALLDGTVALYGFAAGEKGLELLLDVGEDTPRHLLGDALRLSQVLNNLVANAIKFTERGEVRIGVDGRAPDERTVELDVRVSDTGIGMSDAQREQLFQAFQQADSSITRRFGGTGLGLTIAQRLVEAMGGALRVDSVPGEGSTFRFSVRLGRPAERVDRAEPDAGLPPPMRVLVVDDSRAALDALGDLLAAWGFEVLRAADAQAGLRAAREAEAAGAPVELFLLDWQMPGMDGLAMAERLRQMAAQGEISAAPRVVMASAYGHEQLRRAAAGAELHAVLDKPVTPSRLRELLRSIQTHEAPALAEPEHRRQPLAAETARIRGARILLVEDNPTNQFVAKSFLEKMALRVDIADNGRVAVESARAHDYDAILMDLQMPVMDGFEAARRIRALPGGARVPIIAMTAAALAADRVATAEAGFNAHVAKPIELNELVRALLAWVEPSDSPPPAAPVPGAAAESDAPLALPGLELDEAAARLNGDWALLRRVLAGFRRDFADAAQRLDALLAEEAFADAARLAHTVKGLAPSIGAPALAEAALALEQALKAAPAPGGAPDAERGAFVSALDAALAAIAGLDALPPDAPPPAAERAGQRPPPSAEEMDVLHELARLLQQSTIVAPAVRERALEVLRDRVEPALGARLFQAVGQLDYEEAERILEDLLRQLA